jgi:hypothetical protein
MSLPMFMHVLEYAIVQMRLFQCINDEQKKSTAQWAVFNQFIACAKIKIKILKKYIKNTRILSLLESTKSFFIRENQAGKLNFAKIATI